MPSIWLTEDIMRVTHCHLATTFLWLTAVLTLGCHDSTAPAAPTTGAIEITVSTAGASIDIDPGGYTLSIDTGPAEAVGVNTAVRIGDLRAGPHLVRLDGLAPNCSLSGTNPRWVDVTTDGAASPVSFAVSCIAKSEIDPGAGYWDY
jgi:hypothetical protein